jgi:hypothetical protein
MVVNTGCCRCRHQPKTAIRNVMIFAAFLGGIGPGAHSHVLHIQAVVEVRECGRA